MFSKFRKCQLHILTTANIFFSLHILIKHEPVTDGLQNIRSHLEAVGSFLIGLSSRIVFSQVFSVEKQRRKTVKVCHTSFFVSALSGAHAHQPVACFSYVNPRYMY